MAKERMVKKTKKEVIYSGKISAFILSLVLAFVVYGFIIWILYIVHESGHVASCHLMGLLEGKQVICRFTNIVQVPIYPGILSLPAPQQTGTNLERTTLFSFGGPFVDILFIVLVSLYLRKRFNIKNGIYWAVPIGFILLYEVVGNIFCGTDNWKGYALDVCNGNSIISILNNWMAPILMATTILVTISISYPFAKKLYFERILGILDY